MKITTQTKPQLGTGIYTVPDIALILGIPYHKANRWLNNFWNIQFGGKHGYSYSWDIDLTKAVNFPTLIELFTFYQLSSTGVSVKELAKVHNIISLEYDTPYPFATKHILNSLRTDGKKVYFEQIDKSIFSLDEKKQFVLPFIKEFFKKLDFDSDSLAVRYWPLGKDKSVVCDPHHQFGQPVISGTNINADTLYNLYSSGEPIWFIAELYGIEEKMVADAVSFCKQAA